MDLITRGLHDAWAFILHGLRVRELITRGSMRPDIVTVSELQSQEVLMRKESAKLLAAAFVTCALCTGSYAQMPGSTTGAGIDQREANQQQRIQQGVNSGALTRGETNRLEHREQSIAYQEQRMRARDGGQLTAHDRTVLNNRLNRTSNAIYRDKHNGRRSF